MLWPTKEGNKDFKSLKKKKALILGFEQEAAEFHAAGKTLPPALTTLPSQSDRERQD